MWPWPVAQLPLEHSGSDGTQWALRESRPTPSHGTQGTAGAGGPTPAPRGSSPSQAVISEDLGVEVMPRPGL